MANSFVFDPNLCTGCAACRLACTIENDLMPGRSWRRIDTFNKRHRPDLPLYHLSLACNHCDEPACMHACPALAYTRDATTGAVLLDADRCIGCKYCSWACPFDAPTFDPDHGVMTKCTFCNHRLKDGLQPACVSLCPTGALGLHDLDAPRIVQSVDAFPRTPLGPRIRIEPLRNERRIPTMSAAEAESSFVERPVDSDAGISLRSEWSLMAFTLLAAVLVAVVAALAMAERRPSALAWIDALAFATAAVVTMGLASAHLGRKARAWRAILNLRRSWLSREVACLSVFVGAATIWLAVAPEDRRTGIAVAMVGFLALLCADRVYGVLRRAGPGYRHSASVLWTGLFLTGVFSGALWLAVPAGLGKLAMYALRKQRFRETGCPTRMPLALVRVGLGFVVPLALGLADLPGDQAPIVLCVLVGEAIDRGEYYLELERETPRRRMADVLLGRGALARVSS